MKRPYFGDYVTRIQWSRTIPSKITFYGTDGVVRIMEGSEAFAFAENMAPAFEAAEKVRVEIEEARKAVLAALPPDPED